MALRTMHKRIVFGAVLIAVVGGIFALDGYVHAATDGPTWAFATRYPALPIVVVLGLLAMVGFVEFARLAGGTVLGGSGLLGVLLLGLSPWLGLAGGLSWGYRLVENLPATLAVWLMLVFAEQMLTRRLDRTVAAVGGTVLGAAWLGLGVAAMLSIRLGFGPASLLLFLAAVKATDIGAYFTGSLIGKHKMIAWLSPGKSWEGLAGGLVLAGAVGAVWRGLSGGVEPHPMGMPDWLGGAVFGVLVGLAGQFGDLCESLLKRSAGAKDSGALVPEFGGVLDMLDSPLLAGPVAYFLMPLLLW